MILQSQLPVSLLDLQQTFRYQIAMPVTKISKAGPLIMSNAFIGGAPQACHAQPKLEVVGNNPCPPKTLAFLSVLTIVRYVFQMWKMCRVSFGSEQIAWKEERPDLVLVARP